MASPLIGQRRAPRCRCETDPAEGALVPVPPPDMPHRGPVVALVVADLDLAPAAVPHVPSPRLMPRAPAYQRSAAPIQRPPHRPHRRCAGGADVATKLE